MEKFFPIKTPTACRLKWAWSTVYLRPGRTASCHRASLADITVDNFKNFHNLPNKKQDREKMLQGQWPGAGCEYCRDIENAGGTSDRMFQLEIPNVYPPELDSDPSATEVHPVVLEIFFQNTCNLGCLYCDERFSSTIEQENKKFGTIPLLEVKKQQQSNHYDELAPLMWDWLEENSSRLMRLQILGGEPLLQKDFEKIIDFFDQHPNPNLELNFVTNLMVKSKHLDNCVNKLNSLLESGKIARVDILASVDSWGPAQEYVRYGFERDIFDENIRILSKNKNLRVGLLTTVNSLSIHELPFLKQKVTEWSIDREIFWYLHLVLPADTHPMSPNAFDYAIWEPMFESVYQSLEDTTFDQKNTKKTLYGIMSKLKNNKSDVGMQKKLIDYLDEMDHRRDQNWRNVFPWLEKEVNRVV